MDISLIVIDYMSMHWCPNCKLMYISKLRCLQCLRNDATFTTKPLMYISNGNAAYNNERSIKDIIFKEENDQEMQDYIHRYCYDKRVRMCKLFNKKPWTISVSYENDGMGWMIWELKLISKKN